MLITLWRRSPITALDRPLKYRGARNYSRGINACVRATYPESKCIASPDAIEMFRDRPGLELSIFVFPPVEYVPYLGRALNKPVIHYVITTKFDR